MECHFWRAYRKEYLLPIVALIAIVVMILFIVFAKKRNQGQDLGDTKARRQPRQYARKVCIWASGPVFINEILVNYPVEFSIFSFLNTKIFLLWNQLSFSWPSLFSCFHVSVQKNISSRREALPLYRAILPIAIQTKPIWQKREMIWKPRTQVLTAGSVI